LRVLQRSGRAADFIEPRLPSPAQTPPASPDWLHEIKHDGFRILALLAERARNKSRNPHRLNADWWV
jgi:bifunctional non-homologous end joining protein LigD